jgi:hypothetical protein
MPHEIAAGSERGSGCHSESGNWAIEKASNRRRTAGGDGMKESPQYAQKTDTTIEHPGPSGFYMEVVDNDMAAVLRQKTAVERLRIANRMWKSARVILRGAIQTQHSDWTIEQVNQEIARRISHGVVTHETR